MGSRSEPRVLAWAAGLCLLGGALAAWPPSRRDGGPPALDSERPEEAADEARGERLQPPARSEPVLARTGVAAAIGIEPEESDAPRVANRTLRGHVVLAEGAFAAKAQVWCSGARAFSTTEGAFEINAPSLDHPLYATLPGFQPAREDRPAASGNLLRLGPPAGKLHGRVSSTEGRAGEGWRIALLDGTLIEPAGRDAATLEAASSRAPRRVQAQADGSFSVDGLQQRPYTLAAWRAARDRIELYAARPATPDQGPVEIVVPPANLCGTIELRFVDGAAVPLAHLGVGLPGAPAMATTDGQGRLVLTGSLPPRITLVLLRFPEEVLCQGVDTTRSADVVLPFP